MRLPAITYIKPENLQKALSALAHEGEKSSVMGGGTSLVVSLRHRLLDANRIVDISQLEELRFVEERNGYLEIGSATTLETVRNSEILRAKAPILVQAASRVASMQVRNVATVGGNICLDAKCCYYNRSEDWRSGLEACFKLDGYTCNAARGAKTCQAIFSSDLAPALIALDAEATVEREGAKRSAPLLDLYSGKGESPLALIPGEILTSVRVPLANGRSYSSYMKLANREAVDFPLLSVAAVLKFAGDAKELADIRIVLSAISSAPRRIARAEHLLLEKGLSLGRIEEAAEIAYKEARPIDNAAAASAAYRKKMVRVYVARAIAEACREAGVTL